MIKTVLHTVRQSDKRQREQLANSKLKEIFSDLSEEEFEEENISNRKEKRKSIELSESETCQLEEDEELCFTKGMACKTQGTSMSKMHTNRTCEDPFVEADEKSALCFFKLKVQRSKFLLLKFSKAGNELIQNGYLVEIEFSQEIPGSSFIKKKIKN